MSPLLDSVTIILVEPQFPGNIGMTCRAIKNMGVSRLRLVAGCDHRAAEAYKFAVSARDILEQAETFSTLADALQDIEISIGTTRRSGKYRQELLHPDQVPQRLNSVPGKTALVFGREDHGLSTDDLALCSLQATIPTTSEYGSLNLAQAVLLFCWELNQAVLPQTTSIPRHIATSGELEPFFTQLSATLSHVGYLNPQNPEHIMLSLRRIFNRAELDSREVAILRGMLSQINWATDSFSGRK